MNNTLYTRRGLTQTQQAVIKQSIIPELVSESSTPAVTKQQALKTLKRFQGLSYFTAVRGFTLIELLVVVLIIGILAAVAVPQYQKAVEKSRAAEAILILKEMDHAQQLCLLEKEEDCGGEEFFANTLFEPPTSLLPARDCPDGLICFKTEDWAFWSEDWLYAGRISNGEWKYTLEISSQEGLEKVECENYPSNQNNCARIGM